MLGASRLQTDCVHVSKEHRYSDSALSRQRTHQSHLLISSDRTLQRLSSRTTVRPHAHLQEQHNREHGGRAARSTSDRLPHERASEHWQLQQRMEVQACSELTRLPADSAHHHRRLLSAHKHDAFADQSSAPLSLESLRSSAHLRSDSLLIAPRAVKRPAPATLRLSDLRRCFEHAAETHRLPHSLDLTQCHQQLRRALMHDPSLLSDASSRIQRRASRFAAVVSPDFDSAVPALHRPLADRALFSPRDGHFVSAVVQLCGSAAESAESSEFSQSSTLFLNSTVSMLWTTLQQRRTIMHNAAASRSRWCSEDE